MGNFAAKVNKQIQSLNDRVKGADNERLDLFGMANELCRRVKSLEDTSEVEGSRKERMQDKFIQFMTDLTEKSGEATKAIHAMSMEELTKRVELLGAEYVKECEGLDRADAKATAQYFTAQVERYLSSDLHKCIVKGAQKIVEIKIDRIANPEKDELAEASEQADLKRVQRRQEVEDLQHQIELARLKKALAEVERDDEAKAVAEDMRKIAADLMKANFAK